MDPKKSQLGDLTDEEKRLAIDAASRRIFEELGLNLELFDSDIRFASHSPLSEEQQQRLSMALGLRMALKTTPDLLIPDIHTREDLDDALRQLKALGERAPTTARQILGQIRAKLRRRGGPGRAPKLNDKESAIVCDLISEFHRKGYSVTEAIAKTSALCPKLLGKKVAARTLSNYWSKRNQFPEID